MRRLKDYLQFLVWNSGLSYIALWAITFWTLDYGRIVFGEWGACAPDPHTVLFYWVCDAGSPFSILATIANAALTITIWAPIYVAAATVRPDAIAIAVPIVSAHLIGLATAILVSIRLMLALFGLVRRRIGRDREPPAQAAEPAEMQVLRLLPPPPPPRTPPRSTFGLRQSPHR
jgi:hypothetical protein